MNSNTKAKYLFFLAVAGLFLMQDKLQDWFAPFQYFDEAFGLLIVPAALIRWRQGRLSIIEEHRDLLFYAGLLVFCLFGWLSHFVYQYQPLSNALKDCYVNLKFFLAVGASFLIFDDPKMEFKQMKRRLWPILNGVTLVLFILFMVDLLFGVFSTDTRGPFRAVKIFYSAQTVLVAVSVFLSGIYLWYYDQQKERIILPLAMLCVMMFCTLRVKSMGAIAAIVLIYLFVLKRLQFRRINPKAKAVLVGFLVFAGVAIGYQVVSYYILMGTESARAMLTLAAPFVAWDHFPFGSGWATFASAFSAEPYSPVYGMYRMAGIWGISPSYSAFVSDAYWPMILAQTGYFGFAGFLLALTMFVKKALKMKNKRVSYGSALLILAYLLISSTSESALANPMAVPLGFWLGLLMAEHRNLPGKGKAQ